MHLPYVVRGVLSLGQIAFNTSAHRWRNRQQPLQEWYDYTFATQRVSSRQSPTCPRLWCMGPVLRRCALRRVRKSVPLIRLLHPILFRCAMMQTLGVERAASKAATTDAQRECRRVTAAEARFVCFLFDLLVNRVCLLFSRPIFCREFRVFGHLVRYKSSPNRLLLYPDVPLRCPPYTRFAFWTKHPIGFLITQLLPSSFYC